MTTAAELWAKAQRAAAELADLPGARLTLSASLERQVVADFAGRSGGQFIEQLFVGQGLPLVIWRCEAACCGVAVTAQGSRPAEREDLALPVVLCGDAEQAGADLAALRSRWAGTEMAGVEMMPLSPE
jgi:hypothetical protein